MDFRLDNGFLNIAVHWMIALIAFFMIFKYSHHDLSPTDDKLLIGVLSARSHFNERNLIRSSWGSAKNENLHIKFFIGEECEIHPEDRLNVFTCTEWKLGIIPKLLWELVEIQDSFGPVKHHVSHNVGLQHYNSGFGFKVLHDVMLHTIGISSKLLQKVNEDLCVIFKDAEEVFIKLHLKEFTKHDCKFGFCFVKLLQTMFLPKGFEGEIYIETSYKNLQVSALPRTCYWNNGSVVEFLFGRSGGRVYNWRSEQCSFVSAQFEIADMPSLIEHTSNKQKRNDVWERTIRDNNFQLRSELEKYGDIIFLPMVDVYKNLPLKLKQFIRWANDQNYGYILKVDDDSYVNVTKVMQFLPSDISIPTLWSKLRYDFSVQRFGKWSEFDYEGVAYPSFPSGAGYLMSASLVKLVSDSSLFLKRFQGEDVSMGIWTEALCLKTETKGCVSVSKVDVECWIWDENCEDSFIVSQITPEEMKIRFG